MSRVLYLLVFALGLAVIVWVGAGYMGANLLALAVTGLIALAYLFGGLELLRFGQATASLSRALDNLKNATPSLTGTASETTAAAVNTALTAAEGASSSTTPAITIHALDAWLSKLDPSLRDAVRMRVEGERVGLPAPSLTPYLVGLLVLLGMLGTFLGMVATLRGTGLALEHATDLQAIRASLAAPVKGLGFAFGTSVAGVAASAMLGLLAALCRRDRVRVAQRLDAAIAGVLRVFSKSHQRDESFKQMQQHAQALPLVAERLQTMIESLEKRSLEADEKLEQRSLSFLEQAQQRGQEIDQQFQERGLAVDKQLQQNASRLDEGLEHRTDRLHQRLEERAAALDEQLAQKNNLLFQRLEESSAAQNQRLAAEQEAFHANMTELYTELTSSVQRSLSESMSQAGSAVSAAIQPAFESTLAGLSQQAGTLQQSVEQLMQQQIQAFSTQFEQSTNKVADIWVDALAEHRRTSESLIHEQRQASESLIQQSQSESLSLIEEIRRTGEAQAQTQTKASESLASDLRGTLGAFAETFEQRSAALVDNVASKLEGTTASLGQAWADTFATLAASLREEWAQATASTLSSQQELSNTFTQATSDMAAQMREQADSFTQRTQQQTNDFTQRAQQQADDFTQRTQQHAADTIAQVEQLVKAASDAPKMASEVITQMREKLSESLVRDNAMLEERGRLLETLGTLLDAVNQASNEQRTTVDALLNNTSNLLDRIGSQVTDKVETEASKLGYMASQVTESAIQVAELGDTFGKAVESFRESNTSLADHLQRLEQALDNSLTRSDEQLAYYVAQAREVVDLSMLSQKQILEELQQVGGLQANGGAKTA